MCSPARAKGQNRDQWRASRHQIEAARHKVREFLKARDALDFERADKLLGEVREHPQAGVLAHTWREARLREATRRLARGDVEGSRKLVAVLLAEPPTPGVNNRAELL